MKTMIDYIFWTSRRKKMARAQRIFVEIENTIATSKSILNVGCGDGYLEDSILSKYPIEITGVDIKAPTGYSGTFIEGTIESVFLPENHFDIVIFSLSLHHTKDPMLAIEKAKKSLKDDGLLYILEIAPETIFLKTLLFKTGILCASKVQTWTKAELISLITKAGWRIIKKENVPVQGIILHARK